MVVRHSGDAMKLPGKNQIKGMAAVKLHQQKFEARAGSARPRMAFPDRSPPASPLRQGVLSVRHA